MTILSLKYIMILQIMIMIGKTSAIFINSWFHMVVEVKNVTIENRY